MGSNPAPREACSKGSRPRARSSARSSSTRSRRLRCRMKSPRMTFTPGGVRANRGRGGERPRCRDRARAALRNGDRDPGAGGEGGAGGGVGRVGGGRRSGAIDLSLDGVVTQGDEPGSLVFANIDAPPVKPTIEDLEGRVADDPDDPEGHKALGEALIEAGERERGIEELDLATTGFETRGNLRQAQDLVDEILRLDPNSVRHRQKQVEFAFKSGDKAKLIDAYVELADTLLR